MFDWHEWLGHSAGAIETEYALPLADMYAALAYYFDHRAEIDESIRGSQAYAERIKQQIPSKLPRIS